jgi:hypothetical protein
MSQNTFVTLDFTITLKYSFAKNVYTVLSPDVGLDLKSFDGLDFLATVCMKSYDL